jgi:hypothetical protein
MLKAMIDVVAADGEFPVSEKQRRLLVPVSPSTIDRLLKPARKKFMLKGGGLTKAAYQGHLRGYFAPDLPWKPNRKCRSFPGLARTAYLRA